MSKAGVFSPSSQPIFDGQLVRNPTRIQLQGGGAGEFPFQWSWPNLVNVAPAVSPAIFNIAETRINSIVWTLLDPPTSGSITIEFYVLGVLVHTEAGINNNGFVNIPIVIPALAVTGIVITVVGSADASGLWVGMSGSAV
jgi:hypothetical protein